MLGASASIWETILNPFQILRLPVGTWVESLIDWLVNNFREVFQAIRWPIDQTLGGLEAAIQAVPPILVLVIVWLVGWQIAGIRTTIFALIALVSIGIMGAWQSAMTTVSLILTAVIFCVRIVEDGKCIGVVTRGALLRGIQGKEDRA